MQVWAQKTRKLEDFGNPGAQDTMTPKALDRMLNFTYKIIVLDSQFNNTHNKSDNTVLVGLK